MMDKGDFRKRLLLRLATRPVTLLPLVVGVTLLFIGWAFSVTSGPLLFGALACIVGAFGTFFTRLALGTERHSDDVIKDMQKEAHEEREKGLDELDRRLVEDGDARTEACLRDLRALATAFNESKAPASRLGVECTFDIASGVEELFKRCVLSLEQTLDLWRTAERMVTPEAKTPVLAQRERMIGDVGESIKQLGEILAGLQTLRTGDGGRSDLADIRQELDQSLAVARRVEERMREISGRAAPGETE